MDDLLIPYYTNGFKLDWTKVMPINYDDLAMYVHPRVALTFERIWCPEKQTTFSIGHFMETNEDMDCDNFEERVIEFKPFKNARVKRVFEKKRKSIFFDEEEIEILSGIFKNENFTAIVNIYVDGKQVDIDKMPGGLFRIISPLLAYYKIIFPLPASEYRKYKNTKRVRLINKKEDKKVDKKVAILKVVGGAVLSGVGLAGTIVGMKIITDNFDVVLGKVEEAIIENTGKVK